MAYIFIFQWNPNQLQTNVLLIIPMSTTTDSTAVPPTWRRSTLPRVANVTEVRFRETVCVARETSTRRAPGETVKTTNHLGASEVGDL